MPAQGPRGGGHCPGCGARFVRVWWAKYYVNRRAVRRSTRTAKETEARRLLKQWEGNPQAHPKADRDVSNLSNFSGAALADTMGPVSVGGVGRVCASGVGVREAGWRGGRCGRLPGNLPDLGGTCVGRPCHAAVQRPRTRS